MWFHHETLGTMAHTAKRGSKDKGQLWRTSLVYHFNGHTATSVIQVFSKKFKLLSPARDPTMQKHSDGLNWQSRQEVQMWPSEGSKTLWRDNSQLSRWTREQVRQALHAIIFYLAIPGSLSSIEPSLSNEHNNFYEHWKRRTITHLHDLHQTLTTLWSQSQRPTSEHPSRGWHYTLRPNFTREARITASNINETEQYEMGTWGVKVFWLKFGSIQWKTNFVSLV